MEIRNCKYCNRAFGYNGGPVVLCSKCDEELWDKVKSYLKDHPNSEIEKIKINTDVPTSIIQDFLDDDRLETLNLKDKPQINYCTTCGAPTDTNNSYCPNCLEKERKKALLNELKSLYNEEKKPEVVTKSSSRMYTETSNSGRRI